MSNQTKDFKSKYFSNNFYWIDEYNCKRIQEIGIEMGCLNPLGEKELIDWHEGFNNLGFRTYGNNPTKFQKETFLLYNQEATSFKEMLSSYNGLRLNG